MVSFILEDLFIPLILHPLYVLANFSAVMFCYHVIKAIKYSLISNQKYP